MMGELCSTLYKAMLRVLMKLPLLSFSAIEEEDLGGRKEWDHTEKAEIPEVLMCSLTQILKTYTSTWVLLTRYSSG